MSPIMRNFSLPAFAIDAEKFSGWNPRRLQTLNSNTTGPLNCWMTSFVVAG